jgi:hypothetical protein
MVSDGKSGKAYVIEATGDRIGVRPMENHQLVLTNFATTEALREVDLMRRYNLVMRDLYGRYQRIDELIRENFGQINPAMAAAFMGDHLDPVTRTERAVGITVAASNNVTAVVFQPSEGRFWAATGKAPAANNPFIGFDLAAELKGVSSRVHPAVLPPYRWEDTGRKKGLGWYMQAYHAYEENPDQLETVAGLLTKAKAADGSEPVYARMLARIRIYQENYNHAETLLRGSMNLPQSNNELALAKMLLGQSLDLAGRRKEARIAYTEVVRLREKYGNDPMEGINAMLDGLARNYLEKPFSREQIHDISIAFSNESGLE